MLSYLNWNDHVTVTAICVDKGRIAAFFDIKRLLENQYGRVLYLCYQDDTLAQARRTFELMLGAGYSYDNLRSTKSSSQKAHVLFATFQAMANVREAFARDEFRYVVIDEVHHAQTKTLRPTVQYFTPELTLGLVVATRRPGQRIGELFGGNPVEPALHETLASRYLRDADFRTREIQTASVTRNTRSAKLQTPTYRTDSQLIADLARYIRALGRVPKQHEVQHSRPSYLASFSTYVNRLGWPEGKRRALALIAAEDWQFSAAIAPSAVVEAAPSPTQVFSKAKNLGRLPRVSEVDYTEGWETEPPEWVTDDTPTAGAFLVRQTSPADLLTQVLDKAQALGRPPLVREIDADARENPMMATAEEIKAALRASNWREVIDHIRQYI